MKHKSQISILLAVALILGCTGWTPATAQQIRKDNTAPSAPEAMNMESLVEDTQILDYVDSEQFLQADHVARLPQEETLDSYVFLNRDGTRSVYYMGRPVKYVDENGAIREKDTTLVRGTGGYGMRDNDVALHIPDAAGTGITLSHNQRSIKLTPQGGSGSAQMADNSIDYVNFFGKGTILRYTPMLSGMKEDIILAKYTGQNSFTFLLETNGLNLYQDQGRYYLAESQDVEAAFYLGQIDVYDAIGRPDLGTMTAETIVPGQRYRLTVSADEEFLTDPETVYPVTIDPTLTVRDSEEVRGTLEDTPVFSNYPIRNFGNYTFNSMGYVEGFGTAMTAVRLTGLLADTNYAQLTADQLNSVTFHIKSAGGSYANISVHALTENSTWTEMGLTWNTLGAYSTNSYATQAMGNVLWDAFNITNLAKEWKNGTQNPQCGFVLISDSTTIRTATYGGEYGTIDYRPYVVVNYSNAITLDQTSTSVYEGNTVTLTATTIPAGQAVTWESDAPAIASVSDTGVVTGLSKGTATITVTLDAVTSASCTVEVLEKTISFGYTMDIYIYRGWRTGLWARTEPAGEPITWTSLNPDIATVSTGGVVTGIQAGNAIIRASLSNGTYADCEIEVLATDVYFECVCGSECEEDCTCGCKDISLYLEESVTLTAITDPPGQPITWVSMNPTIATVVDGVVTGVGVGETEIRAYLHADTYAVCTVTVSHWEIDIVEPPTRIATGEPVTLHTNTTPLGKEITWSSSDPTIATVSQTGVVTGIKAGDVTITATLADGSSNSCIVEVRYRGNLNYRTYEMFDDSFNQLYLKLLPANTENVTWSSSDTNIAIVNQSGYVIPMNPGVVEITASSPDLLESVSCEVIVRFGERLYWIQNSFNSRLLTSQEIRILNNTTVIQDADRSSYGELNYLSQLWRITYIGNECYTIRPAFKLSLGLSVDNWYDVRLVEIGTEEKASAINANALWKITRDDNGYRFECAEYPGFYMMPYAGSANIKWPIVCEDDGANPACKWNFSRKSIVPHVIVYSKTTGTPSKDPEVNVVKGKDLSFANVCEDIVFSIASNTGFYQDLSWDTDTPDLISVDADGNLHGIGYGTANIIVTPDVPGSAISSSYGVYVTKFKLTGYELEYNPEWWNETEVQPNGTLKDYTNCYAYALNRQVDENDNPAFLEIGVGPLGYEISVYAMVVEEKDTPENTIIDYVKLDAAHYKFYLMEYSEDLEVPEDAYLVALYIHPLYDYHWYRQNPDGTWSHKPGKKPVTDKDASGNVIYDPDDADRNYEELELNYSDLIAYFYVIPLNKIYTG